MTETNRPLGFSESIARLRRAMRRAARAADPNNVLSVAQLELLTVLSEGPERPGQLAKRLHLRPNTITTLVNSLMKLGMLTRRQDTLDRRAKELSVTKMGDQAVKQWQVVNLYILEHGLNQQSVAARRRLMAVVPDLDDLSKIVDRLADQA
jgi:DNA-binding MarR family transcriptional regulator